MPREAQAVWQKCYRQIRKDFPAEFFYRRIEDASGNRGTWDTIFAWCRISAWVELKMATGPGAKPTLRPGQFEFGCKLFDAGVPAGYLVGCPSGMIRLIGPRTNGADWRDHLVRTWPKLVLREVLIELVPEWRGL